MPEFQNDPFMKACLLASRRSPLGEAEGNRGKPRAGQAGGSGGFVLIKSL